MTKIKDAFADYENMLLRAARYSGNKEPGKKSFSASMLGNDVLQNFLKFKHGSSDSTQFEANTFGSIYQLGVDMAADLYNKSRQEEDRYSSAFRHKVTLANGWEVSGEMDQIDNELKVIFDNKVTTATTLASIKKEGKMHGYALQLGVYNWLMYKLTGEEYLTAIPLIDKGFSYFKPLKNNQLSFVEVETYSPDEIEAMLIEKTNELQQFIDLDQEPAECKNLFLYGRKGETKKRMRCLFYCDFAEHCKYYSKHSNAKAILDL